MPEDLMHRRTVIGGLAGVAALVAGGSWYVRRDGATVLDPVEVPALWSPTGDSDLYLPERGQYSIIEVFATSCGICASMMPELGEVADTIDPATTQLVSVSIDPLGLSLDESDIVDWWIDHGGRWPVTSDYRLDLHFTRELAVGTIPKTVVFDRSNRLITAGQGFHDADSILRMLDEARG